MQSKKWQKMQNGVALNLLNLLDFEASMKRLVTGSDAQTVFGKFFIVPIFSGRRPSHGKNTLLKFKGSYAFKMEIYKFLGIQGNIFTVRSGSLEV